MNDPHSGRHIKTPPPEVPYDLIAGTMKDAILMRLSSHTPVTSGERAVILSYTLRLKMALDDLIVGHDLDFSLDSLDRQLDEACRTATANGFFVPEL